MINQLITVVVFLIVIFNDYHESFNLETELAKQYLYSRCNFNKQDKNDVERLMKKCPLD